MNAFFTETVFGLADPNRFGRAGISLVEALDLAAAKIDERFPKDPEQRAVVHDRFGEVYSGIDQPKKAIEQLEKAVSLRTSFAGALDSGTMKSRSNLGLALYQANQFGEAKAVLESNLADQSRVLKESHPDTIETAIRLGLVLLDLRDKDGLAHTEKTYRQAREALGPRHPLTLDAQCMYAWILRFRGEIEKALVNAEPAAIGLRKLRVRKTRVLCTLPITTVHVYSSFTDTKKQQPYLNHCSQCAIECWDRRISTAYSLPGDLGSRAGFLATNPRR